MIKLIKVNIFLKILKFIQIEKTENKNQKISSL